ncbi:moulting cycle domain-containing protein [Ditylenchus destructor]|uniref:Moulting cycle domain-containing protein n=1 Tax=Ditylenchus destructor TaxID=166010 RepID=A0AAD4MGE1_9BILA|nr:moulting cycle domain-containing protein [Ditylenchus destructor]
MSPIFSFKLPSVFNDPAKLKQWISKKKNSTKCKEPMEKLLALLRQGLKLGYTIAGKNTSDFDDKTLKIVSPRFLSVVPEEDQSKNETVDFLSPSLFALHNKGNDVEQAASLPNLMRNFSVGDQDKWMDLIMEAAGVVEQVEKLDTDYKKADDMDEYRKRYEKDFRAKDGTPLYFTPENITKFGNFEQRKIDTHVNLSKSLSKEQIILSPLALSPFILNPAVGSPLVLSPFVLTPILFSPQALGALVLSPYALSPVIQSKLFAYSVKLSPSWLS